LEFPVEVVFRGKPVGKFKLDLVAEHTAIVELKAVEQLAAVHIQQVIAYLTASGFPVGVLINFGAESLEHRRLFPPKRVQDSTAYQQRRP
ncbi:MAG: GxxExxY protein, partial [Anaerolineales bacterium]